MSPRRLRRGAVVTLAALLLVSGLASCTPRYGPGDVAPDAHADLSTCGSGMELVLGVGRAIAPVVTLLAAANNDLTSRHGHLFADTAAEERLSAVLEPLDIILVATRHTIGARVVPGFLTHVALYSGTEAQLRAAGMWNDPLIRPHHAEIRAGARIIETNAAPVTLVSISETLNVDSVVVLRQRDLSAPARQEGLRTAFSYHGTPFDGRFDAESPERVFCTELAYRALPAAGLPLDRIAGRAMIVPDRIAQVALDGAVPLDLVLFLYSDGEALRQGNAALLRATIAANWPAPPDREAPAIITAEAAGAGG